MWNIAGGVISKKLRNIFYSLNDISPGLVSATFDSYDLLPWNGGRKFFRIPPISPQEFVENTIELNEKGISTFFAFNNQLITEQDLDNKWGNYILEQTHNGMNAVICGNELFANFIKKTYPAHKTIGSCSIMKKQLDVLKNLQEFYDILVLPTDLNRDLSLVKELDLSKLEILVSLACLTNCSIKKQHYTLINKWNKSHSIDDLINLHEFVKHPESCWMKRKTQPNLGSNILNKKEINNLINLGVGLFKIQERGDYTATLINIYTFVISYGNFPLKQKLELYKCLPSDVITSNIYDYKYKFMPEGT